MIRPLKALRNHYIFHLFLQVMDALCKILLCEALSFILIAWAYGSHPFMTNFRMLLIATLALLQIPVIYFIWSTFSRIRKLSFKKFIYKFEELNADILNNEASVLVDGDSSSNLIRQYYLYSTATQLESKWGKTKLAQLHPLKSLTFGLMVLVLISSLVIGNKKSHLLLAFYDLVGSSEMDLKLNIRAKKAYLKGTSFDIEGEVQGEPLFPIELRISNESNQQINSLNVEGLEWKRNDQFTFKTTTEGSNENLWIQAYSGTRKSEPVFFRMVEFPQITDKRVTVEAPAYAGANKEIFTDIPFSVLKGSKIDFELKFNKPISQFRIEPLTSEFEIITSTSTSSVTLMATLSNTTSIRIGYKDKDGFEDKSSWLTFNIHEDQKPSIQVLKPNPRLEVSKGIFDNLSLSIDAKDDLGLKELSLSYKARQRFEMTYISSAETIPLTKLTGVRAIQNITAELPSLYIQEGDTISYQILVWDNHPSHGPTFSMTHFITVPYIFQEHEKAEQETQEMIDDLEDIKETQTESESQISRMQKEKIKASKKINSEQQQQLKQLMVQRQEMQKKAEELEERLNQTLQKERENQLLDEGTLMKMEQVRDLYQEVMKDMQSQMRALEQMTRNAPKLNNQQMQNMLQKFDKNKFSEELDRTLQALKKVKTKRKLNKNIKRLEKLKKDHSEIQNLLAQNKQISSTDTARLEEDFKDINKELQELSRNKNLERGLRQQLEKLTNQNSPQLMKNYESMRQALNNDQISKASEQNAEIQKSLEKMTRDIKDGRKKSQQQVMKVDLDQLNLFLRNTFMQSRFIKNVEHEIDFLKGLPRKQYAAREFSYLDSSVKGLGKEIEEAYKANLNFQKVILRIVEMLESKIQVTVDFFAADRPKSRNEPIQEVFRFNNQLTAILINLKDQLEKQRQSMDMSQYMESLQDISEQQQEINQQTQRMDQMIQQQRNQAMQQQLMQQLAFQQQLVRKSTEKLYEQFKNKAELAQNLGQVGQQMQEVEKHLSAEQTGQETQNKQKKIEYKLLEAQQAIKQQQEGKQRKAVKATTNTTLHQRGTSKNIDSQNAQAQEILQRKTIPVQYRSIIQNYLKKLQ